MKRWITGYSILIPLLVITSICSAQYAIVPGEPPPLPDSHRMEEVDSFPPFGTVESIPDLPADVLDSLALAGEQQMVWSGEWSDVVRIELIGECCYFFLGEWWSACLELDNLETVSQASPSLRYFAAGGDGTGARRGPVYVIDLKTGMMYRTTEADIWDCSSWTEGDHLLIEMAGDPPGGTDPWLADSLLGLEWVNVSFLTEAGGSTCDIALYHQGSTWMILPEDRFYSYRLCGAPVSAAGEINFDVVATANVVPQLAGIGTRADFSAWIDSAGGYDQAFPQSGFRCCLDIDEPRIISMQPLGPAMVVEGFLNSMKAGDYFGMLDYVTHQERMSITEYQEQDVRSSLYLYRDMDFSILDMNVTGEKAVVVVEVTVLGFTTENSLSLVLDSGRWLIESL